MVLENGCKLCCNEPLILKPSLFFHLQQIFLPMGIADYKAKKLLKTIESSGYRDWISDDEGMKEISVVVSDVTGMDLTKAIFNNFNLLEKKVLLEEGSHPENFQGFNGKDLKIYEELAHYYSSFPTINSCNELPLLLSMFSNTINE